MALKRLRFILPLVLIAITVIFIWSNSLKDAEASTSQSDFVGGIMQEIFDVEKSPMDYIYENRRSVAHFLEFAFLGVALALFCVLNLPCRLSLYARGAACGFLVAVIDECIQIFVPGRAAELSDLALDCGGVTLGILTVTLFAFLVRLAITKLKKA